MLPGGLGTYILSAAGGDSENAKIGKAAELGIQAFGTPDAWIAG